MLFHFLDGVFWNTNVFNFDGVQHIHFSFITCMYLRQHYLTWSLQRFILIFSSETCIILAFTFKPVIYFELIFVQGVRQVKFIFLPTHIYLFYHNLLKKVAFFHWMLLYFYQSQLSIFVWFCFWVVYSYPLIHVSIPLLVSLSVCYNSSNSLDWFLPLNSSFSEFFQVF